jgi:hypothetical protein
MNSGATDFIRTHTKEINDMSIKKKVTDFVRLEQGSIGHKAAMVTGAAMVAGVLAATIEVPKAKASALLCTWAHSHVLGHIDNYNYQGSTSTPTVTHNNGWPHMDSYYTSCSQ